MIYKILNKQVNIEKDTLKGTAYEQTGIDHPYLYEFVYNKLREFGKEDIFIDAGANIGLFSLLIEKGKVIAFEPIPETFVKLLSNCSRNKDKKIMCVNNALYSCEIPFEIEYYPITGCNRIHPSTKGEFTITLDKWCKDNLKENENIRMIKIDTEGCDYNVLIGAEEVINKYHPVILIEVNKSPKEEIRTFLESKGYKINEEYTQDWIAEYET